MEERGKPSSTYGVVQKIVLADPAISVQAKALYALLSTFLSGGSSCFPSNDLLCEYLGCSPQTLMRWMKELEDHQVIHRKYHFDAEFMVKRRTIELKG